MEELRRYGSGLSGICKSEVDEEEIDDRSCTLKYSARFDDV
jgi:hypothetical protein